MGPCDTSCPSIFDYVGRAKWQAWNMAKELSKEQAMQQYIDELGKVGLPHVT